MVCLPIAWAAVRAAAGGWVPIGDDAYFTVRARDVATVHHPLLGAWSSGSAGLETQVNNLGALQADLLAPFVRWFPMGGTAIGVATVNIVCVILVAWAARRAAGPPAALLAMLVTALLTWTMGSEMLITPRQHQFLIVPYLALLAIGWSAATGDRWALVPAVWLASLLAQTHLSYPILVAAVALLVGAGQIVAWRSGRASGGRAPLIVSAVSVVLAWGQPLLDQWFGERNLTAVVNGTGESESAGLARGLRLVARLLVSPDTLLRPGYRRFDTEAGLAATWAVAVLIAAIASASVVAAAHLRRGDRAFGWGWALVVTAVVAGIVDAALLPVTRFGLAIMNYRWLWATGAFAALLILADVSRRLAVCELQNRQRRAALAALVAVAVLGVCNLPRSVQHIDAARYLSEQRNVELAVGQIDRAIEGLAAGTEIVVDDSEMYFGHPYTYPAMIVLQEHGLEARFEADVQGRRFGERRLADGSERLRLRLVSGAPGAALQRHADTVAYVGGERPVAFLLVDTRTSNS